MSAAFAEVEATLVEKGFELTENNSYSTTYAKWNTSDKGWTEIILDREYQEVAKDTYAADNRRLNRTTAPIKSAQAVSRLIG
jgi:hypothetical protein